MASTRKSDSSDDPARRLLDTLGAILAPFLAAGEAHLFVAFSGGLDSSVLLHAVTRTVPAARVIALNVDHGWHAESAAWSAYCERVAASLGIACTVRRIDAKPQIGASAEAAARRARYAAFAEAMGDGDWLLTAHHGDDQLETLLLRLLRGAGTRGLRAVAADRPFGRGRLVRPLLEFSRAELEQVARGWGIEALNDPANADLSFDRNYLRSEVLPPLRARWPAAHRLAARTARHMAAAEEISAALATTDGAATATPDRVPLTAVTRLSGPRQVNLLRALIARSGLPTPSERQLAELIRQIASAPAASLHLAWAGGEARGFNGHLFLQTPLPAAPRPGRVDPTTPWRDEEDRLCLVRSENGGIPASVVARGLNVDFRRGGERFVPAGAVRHKTLKHWFQENRIVPWMRGRVPLLYSEGRLVAVADLALAAGTARTGEPAWRPVWERTRRLR